MDLYRFTAAALLCMVSVACRAEKTTYISVTVPGGEGTYPTSINRSMVITGYYRLSATEARGFVRQTDGVIYTFFVPGSLWTEPESINDEGDIAGFYESADGSPRGFLRLESGRILISESASPANGPASQPVALNTFKWIAGNYPQAPGSSAAFIRSADGDFGTFFLGEGAEYSTVVTDLNDSGTAVGYITSGGGAASAFFRHPNGFTWQFSVPVTNESSRNFNFETIADAINADGTIAGWYTNCLNACKSTVTGGYVRSVNGDFTLFSPPGTLLTTPRPSLSAQGDALTAPHWLSISHDGSIAGSYIDAQGRQHGFVRCPAGDLTSFDPPDAQTTTVTGINDVGVIVGIFYGQSGAKLAKGFVRIPVTQHAER